MFGCPAQDLSYCKHLGNGGHGFDSVDLEPLGAACDGEWGSEVV